MPLLMFVGLLLFAGGFVTIFALLANHGGMDKSKQLNVLSELLSGRRGKGTRRVMILAMCAEVMGACSTFAGVAQKDRRRADACKVECVRRGYRTGKIRGSTELVGKSKKQHKFVACACTDGPEPDPLELRAESLDF